MYLTTDKFAFVSSCFADPFKQSNLYILLVKFWLTVLLKSVTAQFRWSLDPQTLGRSRTFEYRLSNLFIIIIFKKPKLQFQDGNSDKTPTLKRY